MAKMIFYPIGNADTSLIHLDDGRLILVDYCRPDFEDDDKRVDLMSELGDYVHSLDRDYIDVVAFSHADDDHLHKAEEFFWLDFDKKYQEDGRIKINELHVPANFIVETGLQDTAKIIQTESRYRLKEGKGILVYGYPEQLQDWFEKEGIDPKTREKFMIHAGQIVPGFTKENGGVEIFVHAPFSFKLEGDIENRNENSIVLHITFFDNNKAFSAILGADAEHEVWANIVKLTEVNSNQEKLSFDLFRISHHCSYTALSDKKGKTETSPREEVVSLFDKGENKCILISSSWAVPEEDSDQPPHLQAKAFYKKVVEEKGDKDNFLVTMEHPNEETPRPIIVETSKDGLVVKKIGGLTAAAQVTRRQPPRVG